MRRLFIAVALAAPGSLFASTHWLCGLSDDLTRIVCVSDEDPTATEPVAAQPTTAVVNGTRFPLDPRRVYTVPLWSPAVDRTWVERLASASVCYRSPGCQVTLVAPMLESGRKR